MVGVSPKPALYHFMVIVTIRSHLRYKIRQIIEKEAREVKLQLIAAQGAVP